MSEQLSPSAWTNGGLEVLILKCVPRDGKTYGGFQWPLTVGAKVGAPDWNAEKQCGGGLRGWPWGLALGDGRDPDWFATWIVFGAKPEDVVDLDGKCKARRGTVRFVGDWQSAMMFVLAGQMAWVHASASGAASATGDSGAASATGVSGAASATGWRGAASATGWRGAASATGWSGAASATGDSGAASATGVSGAASATGWRGAAECGETGCAAATGPRGRAKGGEGSVIALMYEPSRGKPRMCCATVGRRSGDLAPGVWYELDGRGRFRACKEQEEAK